MLDAAPASSHGFTADVARLLQLMAHSVYSERDVFLRELVANAADACEKLRHEALSDGALAEKAGAPLVTIALDKEKRLLTVTDNGVGMDRDELVSALGTIANSGTRAFLDKLGSEKGENLGQSLIGQFGVGFYSVFMVADKVEVATRRAGSEQAWLWTSEGKGTYTIEAAASEDAPAVGTRVTLHLNAESDEFLESWRVERVLKEHSGAIAIPIDLLGAPGEEPRRITDGQALWTKPKSEITPEEYTDFYHQLSGQFDEPALTIHWRAEGRTEYTVLAFIPGARPLDLFDPLRRSRAKLYVRRVLISKEIDLLPAWLRFVRLVVDSADIPLNVSREMAQNSPLIAQIGKAITTRIAQEISKLAENEPEKFAQVWKNFGAVLKEGLHEDPSRRDEIFKIARFASTNAPEPTRTLKDYVADLRENQTAVYYLLGDDRKRLASSPQLEEFRARGVEVLLLDDPVDAFWVTSCVGYDGKPFKSVTQGAADLSQVPLKEGETAPEAPESAGEVAALVTRLKETLKEHVEDVRLSTRLRDSAVCLIAPEHGLDRRLAKLLAEHGESGALGKPVLEINPRHPAILALAKLAEGEEASDGAFMLLDLARIADGEPPVDAAAFARRLAARLAKMGA
ncbi:molecular chaperone HtpG [Methylocystis bryophila]|uniref:Chaperone protein HtpG n=1 Tax=Methylocystis bryophila TaxID=655015 RepID=A0A1W6N1C8_9HYPH|nr:molecular chaperone HtpG [Methylocystis bryophila]